MMRGLHFSVALLGLCMAYSPTASWSQGATKHPAVSSRSQESNRKPVKQGSSVPVFTDVAAKVGLTVSHISSPDMHYIMESMSGGIGLFDCDDDGRLDLVMVNGSSVERYRKGGDP